MAWQSVVPLIANAAVNAWGTYKQNQNIDKQLEAQAAENAKIRSHNLNLAKLQNTWNLQQWQRENAYNDPSAQIARMRAAGLNPDMMYGGGVSGNLSASSPSMSSGAAATPMDWSSLGNKKTIAQAAAETLSLEQMRANIRKTNAEAGINESDLKYRDKLNEIGINTANLTNEKIGAEIERISIDARRLSTEADIKTWQHEIQKNIAEKESQYYLRKLAAEADISENEAEFRIKTLVDRIAGVSAETTALEWTSNFTNSEWGVVVELLKRILPNAVGLLKR